MAGISEPAAAVTLFYPDCPTCGGHVTNLIDHGRSAEDQRLGSHDVVIMQIREPFVLEPCQHEFSQYTMVEGRVVRWDIPARQAGRWLQ